LNIPCKDVNCSVAVLSLLVSGTARLRRQEKFREFLRVQNCAWQALFPLMENNLRKTSVPVTRG
jgi:hypothetical protein